MEEAPKRSWTFTIKKANGDYAGSGRVHADTPEDAFREVIKHAGENYGLVVTTLVEDEK